MELKQNRNRKRMALAGVALVLVLLVVLVLVGVWVSSGSSEPAPVALNMPTVTSSPVPVMTPVPVVTPVAAMTSTPTAEIVTPRPTALPTNTPRVNTTPVPVKLPTRTPTPTRPPRIAFVSERDGNKEIYSMNVDGSEVRRLTDHPGDDWHPAWSPNGDRIAFGSDDGTGIYNLYFMNRDGSNRVRMTSFSREELGGAGGVSRPAWSPDGGRIAFTLDTSGDKKGTYIYWANIDGSDLRRLANGRHPSWGPHGLRLVYSGTNASAVQKLMSSDLDGRRFVQMTQGTGTDIYPAWSPDGLAIAYVVGDRPSINVADAATYKPRVLVNRSSTGLSWSPDCKWLLYAPPGGGIRVLSVDNPSDDRQLSEDGTMPAWSP